ncbi:MAG: hypothetical protein KC478_04610 [Bacteriovoracaceae bacterium]|nr:hypothetical protein [Bacteriovoracaceae bacterium]
MNVLKVAALIFLCLGLSSCVNNYQGTGKSIYYLYSADPVVEEEVDYNPQLQQEFIIDNSVYIEDVAWDYSPQDDMNTFGDNNSQLELEFETDAPPRLQFKDRQFP